MKIRGLTILICGTLVVLVACGKKEDKDKSDNASTLTPPFGEKPAAAAGLLAREQAQAFINNKGADIGNGFVAAVMGDSANEALGALGRPAEAGFMTLEEGEEGVCDPKTAEGSSEADADEDGIADNMIQEFNCTSDSATSALSVKGVVKTTDKDPAAANKGFKFEVNDYDYSFETKGDQKSHVKTSAKGSFETTLEGTTFKTNTNYSTKIDISGPGQAFNSVSGTYYDVVYEPKADDNNEPFDKGAVKTVEGYIIANEQTADGSSNYTLKVSAKDLVREECEIEFDSGSFTLTDGFDNKLEATFKACEVSWTYNGHAL